MTVRKTLLVAAIVLLSVPVVPALAHDDEDYGYDAHDRFHDQLSDAHERAHEYGFYSRGEHRAYHRALFGTFMTRLTDINRDTTIIQGLVITATAMAIGAINSVSGWGRLAPQSRTLAILRAV